VKDAEGNVKRRRYKPHELLVVDTVANTMNMDRKKRDEKSTNKYKTVNKLIRNEDMTRTEAKKVLKGIDDNVLGPARNTRSQDKTTRSQTRVNKSVAPTQVRAKTTKRKTLPAIDIEELLSR
jgi:hypothetical protein